MKKRLRHFIISVIVYGLMLFAVHLYFPNIFAVESSVYGITLTFVVLAVLFWILNNIVKAILDLLTLPFKYMTFGLSSLVLDMLFLYLFQYIVNGSGLGITIRLGSVLAVLVLALFVSLVAFLLKKIG